MWKTVKLGEVCYLVGGGTPSKRTVAYYDGTIPWATVRDMASDELYETEHKITNEGLTASSSKIIPKGNIIIASRVGLGKVCILQQNTAINQDLRGVVPKHENEIDRKFLFYWFKGVAKDIIAAGRGATVQGVTLPFLNSLSLPLPPLAEQQRIVTKLDAAVAEIDKAVALTEAKEAEIDSLKSSLLGSAVKDANSDTEMWKTIKLSNVIKYKKKNGKGSKLPYVGMENISKETMELVGDIVVPESTSTTFVFDDTQVLYGRLRPYLRKILVPDFEGQCSTEIFCLQPNHDLNRKFLAYWLLSPRISQAINETSTGARMPRANMNAILNFDFLLPPLFEQQRIIAKLDATFTEVANASKAVAKSKENYQALKSAILAKELQSEAA